jgi:hypothetical protein
MRVGLLRDGGAGQREDRGQQATMASAGADALNAVYPAIPCTPVAR